MFTTSNQLAAAARNTRRDKAFWSDAEAVAKWERETQEYEEFCKKFGYPE